MAKVIRLLLLSPLALLYASVVFLRNKLFDWQIFRSWEFKVPIICVGNLELGGSGKTPMSDFLISHFSEKFRITYLSRGYRRKSTGFRMATDADSVESLGDEAYLIFQKWKEKINLAVDANRRRGIANILKERPETQLILLDDGMQHRWVKPRFLIQLTPFAKPFFDNYLFPYGTLRDQKAEYKRCDALVFTKAPFASSAILNQMIDKLKSKGFVSKPTYISSLHYLPARNLQGEVLPKGSEVVAISGLASNIAFFDYTKTEFSVSRSISKPDHYRYLPSFFKTNLLTGHLILTTEKDFYKLIEIAPKPDLVYYIPIEMNIFPQDQFLKRIEDQL